MISYTRRRPAAAWKRFLVAALAIGAMAISAVPVQATFPNDNGRIAFRNS